MKEMCIQVIAAFFGSLGFAWILKIKGIRELEHSIETEEFLKCDILKNAIEDLKKKNLKFRRRTTQIGRASCRERV